MSLTRGLVFQSEVSLGVMPDVAYTYDKSREKNNGSNTSITYTRLPSGLWAHYFNGTGYVSLGSTVPSLYFGNKILTISFWVNLSSLTDAYIIYNGATNATTKGYMISANSGTVYFYISDGASRVYAYTSAGLLETNKWYHCLGTSNGTTSYIYVNGIVGANTGNVAPLGDIAYTTTKYWGRTGGTPRMTGYLTKVNYWNRYFSAVEVIKLFNRDRWMFGV